MTDPTPLPFHLDDGIIRASDGTWCYPANGTEKDLFAALAVSAADNAALQQSCNQLRAMLSAAIGHAESARKRVEELEAALRGLMDAEARGRIMPIGPAWDVARALLSQHKEPKHG